MRLFRREATNLEGLTLVTILVILFGLLIYMIVSSEKGTKVISSDGKEVTRLESDEVEYLEHNGHRYIKFQFGIADNSYGGVVHDPDCSCNQ